MAEEYLALNDTSRQERVKMIERRVERRIRDAQNPFQLPNNEFIAQFRVNKDLVMDIANVLRPYLQKERTTDLSVEIQILVALGFFATGSYQRPTGNSCDLTVSQLCTSRCIRKVAQLINIHLLRQWVRFPMTASERAIARDKFAQAPESFPGAIGAIDCTHINILAPHIHKEAYVNHHGNHSLNVQAIVDPDLKVLNINARYPGARNDASIWNASPIRNVMKYSYDHGERRTYLIGDAEYPLERWLMTPLPHYPRQSRQFHYNEKLCKAKSVVERFFGVLKGTWRCLSYQQELMYAPEIVGQIVNACVVLHNMRLYYRLPIDMEEQLVQDKHADPGEKDNDAEIQDVKLLRPPSTLAQRIQKQIMREWFPNYYCAWDNEGNT